MTASRIWKQMRASLLVTLGVLLLELALAHLVARDDVLASILSQQQYWWLGLMGLLVACRLLLYFVMPPWLLWRLIGLGWRPTMPQQDRPA